MLNVVIVAVSAVLCCVTSGIDHVLFAFAASSLKMRPQLEIGMPIIAGTGPYSPILLQKNIPLLSSPQVAVVVVVETLPYCKGIQ
jgi:hypothetical protein